VAYPWHTPGTSPLAYPWRTPAIPLHSTVAFRAHTWLVQMDISYDRFIRTTRRAHEALVAQFFARCEGRGDIARAQYEGLYCVPHAKSTRYSSWTKASLLLFSFHFPFSFLLRLGSL